MRERKRIDAVLDRHRTKPKPGGDPGGRAGRLSEDETIADPVARKAALRAQVRAAGAPAATVFAADKLSKARELRTRLSNLRRLEQPLPPEVEHQHDHYVASLEMLEGLIPEQPIVSQLRFELETLRILPPGEPGA